MHFANGQLGWLLVSLPIYALVLLWHRKRYIKRLSLFADAELHPFVAPIAAVRRRALSRTLYTGCVIVGLLVLAVLRPQWGFTWREQERHGVDIVVAVDVSESMLAKDIQPNRLERARWEIEDLLDDLQGDRIALVTFAGVAFIESPLTLDYGTFRGFLKSLNTDLIPIQGTNIEIALNKSLEALVGKEGARRLPNGGAIILITDGESFAGDVTTAASRAKELGVRIYIMGVGTTAGSPIVLPTGYKKDKNGQVIISRLNTGALQELARLTGGIYVNSITSNEDVDAIYKQGIKRVLEENTLKDVRTKVWHEYFQLPLLMAVIMIFTPILLIQFRRLRQARRDRIVAVICLLALMRISVASDALAEYRENLGARAVEEFKESNFDEALATFNEGSDEHPEDFRFDLGRGASHYRKGEYGDAKAAFSIAAGKAPTGVMRAAALFNMGNAQVQLGELQEAIQSYEESLKLAPQTTETLRKTSNMLSASYVNKIKRIKINNRTKITKTTRSSRAVANSQTNSSKTTGMLVRKGLPIILPTQIETTVLAPLTMKTAPRGTVLRTPVPTIQKLIREHPVHQMRAVRAVAARAALRQRALELRTPLAPRVVVQRERLP